MTAVVAQHCGLLPFGWAGVWLFFVISGYVVTGSVIAKPQTDSPARRLKSFFSRRTRRIVPVYYAYVLAGVALAIASGATLEAYDVASLLGFFHNVAMGAGRGTLADWPVGHLWTISVEMQFYLVFGICLILLPRRWLIALLFVVLLATPVARWVISLRLAEAGLGDEASAFILYSGAFLHTDIFAAGALLAFADRHGFLDRIARPLACAGMAALIAYCAFYVWINFTMHHADGMDAFRNIVSGVLWGQYREVFVYSALGAAATGLVALAATNDPLTDRLLRHRLLQRIGETSYGAYIFHALAIVVGVELLSVVFEPGEHSLADRLLLFAVSYAVTVAAAELSYRHFESRFTRKRPASTIHRPALAAE